MFLKNFTKKTRPYLGLISLATLLTAVGCEREVINSADNETINNQSEVGDYLSFKNYGEFDSTITVLAGKKFTEVKDWESTKGFVSLQTLFEKAVQEEAANYESEEKILAANPNGNVTHKQSVTAKLLGDMLIYDTKDGGIELNLASLNMASVLNRNGIVKIGNRICQFTYSYNKSIQYDGDIKKATDELKSSTVSSSDGRIFVGKIKNHKIPLSVPNARPADYNDGYSCDHARNSEWRVIGYMNEFEGTQQLEGGPIRLNEITYMVRTLKRGTFGAWYNRSTSLQSLHGNFKIRGNLPSVNNWVTVLAPGYKPFNPFVDYNFNMFNNRGETSEWGGALFRSEPEYTYSSPAIHSSDIRMGYGTSIYVNWNGDYNCHCSMSF